MSCSKPLYVTSYVDSRNGNHRWRVQRTYQGVKFCGTFHTEEEAYEALQNKWPDQKKQLTKSALIQTADDLKRTVSEGKGNTSVCGGLGVKRQYEGVSFEVKRRKWRVQYSGQRFDNEKDAALAYAANQGRTLSSLKLVAKNGVGHRFHHESLQQEFQS